MSQFWTFEVSCKVLSVEVVCSLFFSFIHMWTLKTKQNKALPVWSGMPNISYESIFSFLHRLTIAWHWCINWSKIQDYRGKGRKSLVHFFLFVIVSFLGAVFGDPCFENSYNSCQMFSSCCLTRICVCPDVRMHKWKCGQVLKMTKMSVAYSMDYKVPSCLEGKWRCRVK